MLFTTDAEADSGAEISAQRRISRHFLIEPFGQVFPANISSDPRPHLIPDARIHQHISRSVSNAKTEEVGIGAAADETPIQVSAPAPSQVIDQRGCGMFRPAKQRLAFH